MCTCKSKTLELDCNVEELKKIEKESFSSSYLDAYDTDLKSELFSDKNKYESSPPIRANKPKITVIKNKIPKLLINQETYTEDKAKDKLGQSAALLNSNTKDLKDIANKPSFSTDTVENNLMASFTKSSNKSPEVDQQDKKFDTIEKNLLLSMDTIKEETVFKVKYFNTIFNRESFA